jgi:hypothetical protein
MLKLDTATHQSPNVGQLERQRWVATVPVEAPLVREKKQDVGRHCQLEQAQQDAPHSGEAKMCDCVNHRPLHRVEAWPLPGSCARPGRRPFKV